MSRVVTVLATPSGLTSEDVVESIEGSTRLSFEGEPTGGDVAGFSAVVLEATAEPNPDQAGDPAADIAAGTVDLDNLEAFVTTGFQLTTSTPEARLRFVVIEVDGRVVIAWLEAPAAEADSFFADGEALLGSLKRQT